MQSISKFLKKRYTKARSALKKGNDTNKELAMLKSQVFITPSKEAADAKTLYNKYVTKVLNIWACNKAGCYTTDSMEQCIKDYNLPKLERVSLEEYKERAKASITQDNIQYLMLCISKRLSKTIRTELDKQFGDTSP